MYRRLRREELEELEPQFVRFLAAQSIPGEDWAKMKVTNETRANTLIDQFSNMVFDDVIKRTKFAEQRTERQLLTFRCGDEKLELRGLVIEGETSLDLRQEEPAEEMMAKLKLSEANLKLISAERVYRPDRATEVFALLEQQAKISQGPEMFDLLDGMVESENESE